MATPRAVDPNSRTAQVLHPSRGRKEFRSMMGGNNIGIAAETRKISSRQFGRRLRRKLNALLV